ncbi:sensor histidine kinase [Defluviitalea raffinosedens]|uniref:histidine kinase n=1 Tax=Defluviitalea raffinosedens TaxID=1450156 RepID=A0A7C8LDJ7_9FIRM|nr:HAMP domain-containing sensor histidine kinase [Defluviitalea raffinosedens]KAE9632064.1 GHKL domain-containing protein [Defluviitalea raffinosedens]MBM7685345.1 signal transduction histidine kinase [Defluviitalea raffinosedens]HHW66333.1 HAMP domain-containing histidine kinase [Candidatus Epulonipiscium sp.]
MDIKLKSKIRIIAYALTILALFSFGFRTTDFLANKASYYLKGSYFNTREFADELEDFIYLFEQFYMGPGESYVQNVPVETNEEFVAEIYDEETDEEYTYTTEVTEEYNIVTDRQRFEYEQSYINYYIKDRKGNIYTNLENYEDFDSIQQSSFFVCTFPYHTKGNDVFTSINRFFITKDLTGFIAIPKSDKKHSLIVENMYDYQDEMTNYLILLGTGITALISSIVLGYYYLKKYASECSEILQPLKKIYSRYPIDLRICVLLLNLLFINTHYTYIEYYPYYYLDISDFAVYTVALTVLIIQIIFLLPVFKSLQHIKTEWEKSFIVNVKKSLEGSFLFKSGVIKILLILGIVSFLGIGTGIALGELGMSDILALFPFGLIISVCVLIYIFSKVAYFNRLLKYSEDILAGNANGQIIRSKKGLLGKLAENLDRLKEGIDTSQKVQVKSERLKTELITNVSHDLRTPLTSIINYTELLKDKQLSEEEREKYIEIIDKKSKRLKVLIDDLFEVSKMASGNIELSKEKVDIVQLLKQALAEYDEKIQAANLDFKITFDSPHIFAWVDGRKMWRVFDNIISNIVKYTLENTRVYITITERDYSVVITFKNISKYELPENIDELLERFKRGDESRSTEGSGLGLAIAKSIVDSHEGRFDIETDGDLFKTIVEVTK